MAESYLCTLCEEGTENSTGAGCKCCEALIRHRCHHDNTATMATVHQ